MDVIELPQILRLIAALSFVVALMIGLWAVSKRFGLHGAAVIPASKKRLKVVEMLPLDARRRLALIRCDDKDHLIILGPNNETVIETGIDAVHQDNDGNAPKQENKTGKHEQIKAA